jgi:hypothetical protein
MRLTELVGVKSLYNRDLEGVLKSIEQAGDQVIGKGAYGIAVKNKNGEIIKFWVEDSAYDDFIDYIIKHPSKFFPKLLSKPKQLSTFFTRPVGFPDKIKYVYMEELGPWKVNDDGAEVEIMMKLSAKFESEDIAVSKWKSDAKLKDNKDLRKVIAIIGEENLKEFYHVSHDLIKVMEAKGHKLDIQGANLMMRGDQLVILDPVTNLQSTREMSKIRSAFKELVDMKKSGQLDSHPHKSGTTKEKINA